MNPTSPSTEQSTLPRCLHGDRHDTPCRFRHVPPGVVAPLACRYHVLTHVAIAVVDAVECHPQRRLAAILARPSQHALNKREIQVIAPPRLTIRSPRINQHSARHIRAPSLLRSQPHALFMPSVVTSAMFPRRQCGLSSSRALDRQGGADGIRTREVSCVTGRRGQPLLHNPMTIMLAGRRGFEPRSAGFGVPPVSRAPGLLAPRAGIEPAIGRLTAGCLSTWLPWNTAAGRVRLGGARGAPRLTAPQSCRKGILFSCQRACTAGSQRWIRTTVPRVRAECPAARRSGNASSCGASPESRTLIVRVRAGCPAIERARRW